MTSFSHVDPARYAVPPDLEPRLLTPALAVHLDRVRANVRRIVTLLGGDPGRWRPHVKTTKLPVVWRVLLDEGVRHFKCATTRELAVLLDTLQADLPLGERGDVLVAYPHRGPALRRIAQLAADADRVRVSVLIEDADVLPDLAPGLGVYLDVNPGMDRTGLPAADADSVLRLAREAGPRLRGLHWYDGHLHAEDLALRGRQVGAGLERARQLVRLLRDEHGLLIEELISAGTPAFLSSLEAPSPPGISHRLSPGTVVFHDLRSERENAALELEPAAVVLTRVVSHPGPDLATCDAGSKSVAAEAGRPVAEALGHPGLSARAPSEEHLPFDCAPGARPARGTVLALVPMHVCPTVNLAEAVLLFDEGRFVGTATVAARAHELLLGS